MPESLVAPVPSEASHGLGLTYAEVFAKYPEVPQSNLDGWINHHCAPLGRKVVVWNEGGKRLHSAADLDRAINRDGPPVTRYITRCVEKTDPPPDGRRRASEITREVKRYWLWIATLPQPWPVYICKWRKAKWCPPLQRDLVIESKWFKGVRKRRDFISTDQLRDIRKAREGGIADEKDWRTREQTLTEFGFPKWFLNKYSAEPKVDPGVRIPRSQRHPMRHRAHPVLGRLIRAKWRYNSLAKGAWELVYNRIDLKELHDAIARLKPPDGHLWANAEEAKRVYLLGLTSLLVWCEKGCNYLEDRRGKVGRKLTLQRYVRSTPADRRGKAS